MLLITVIMEPKRKRASRASTSTAQLAQEAPTFPNYKFLSENNAKKYLKLLNYRIVRENTFDCENLDGYEEFVDMLQQRKLVRLNNLIQHTNKCIRLEFYANDAYLDINKYKSYVRGKYVDFSAKAINSLLGLQMLEKCKL